MQITGVYSIGTVPGVGDLLYVFKDGGYFGSFTTGAGGAFEIDSLGAGTYTFFEGGGYLPQSVVLVAADAVVNLDRYADLRVRIYDGGVPWYPGTLNVDLFIGGGYAGTQTSDADGWTHFNLDAIGAVQILCGGVWPTLIPPALAFGVASVLEIEIDPDWIAPTWTRSVPYQTRYTDDFHRPDCGPADIGVGAPSGFVPGAGSFPCIRSHAMTSLFADEGGDGNGYWTVDLGLDALGQPVIPVAMGGEVEWVDDGGTLDAGAVMDCSNQGPGVQPGVHMACFGSAGLGLLLWTRDGVTPGSNLGAVPFTPVAGTHYQWSMDLLGDTFVLHAPDGTTHTVANGQIGPRLGQYLYYQPRTIPGQCRVRWHNIWADVPEVGGGSPTVQQGRFRGGF